MLVESDTIQNKLQDKLREILSLFEEQEHGASVDAARRRCEIQQLRVQLLAKLCRTPMNDVKLTSKVRELEEKNKSLAADHEHDEQRIQGLMLARDGLRKRAECAENCHKELIHTLGSVEQNLGQALGLPWFCADQKNFPGSTPADGVVLGPDDDVKTLAARASDAIREAMSLLDMVQPAPGTLPIYFTRCASLRRKLGRR